MLLKKNWFFENFDKFIQLSKVVDTLALKARNSVNQLDKLVKIFASNLNPIVG